MIIKTTTLSPPTHLLSSVCLRTIINVLPLVEIIEKVPTELRL